MDQQADIVSSSQGHWATPGQSARPLATAGAPSLRAQRLLDLAMRWRAMAQHCALPHMQPLFIEAARALEHELALEAQSSVQLTPSEHAQMH